MNTATIEIPYRGRLETFRLWFIGDVHAGSQACDESKFLQTLEQIKLDRNARVFLVGDLAEYIPRGEWRWREEMVAEWVDRSDVAASECDWLVDQLKPIQPKILGAIQGNHELALEDAWNQNVHRRLCDELKIRDLGYTALVRLLFAWRRGRARNGRNTGGNIDGLVVYLHHGFGGGATDGADINRFSPMQRDYDADMYISGHTHRRFASKSLRHFLNANGRLDAKGVLVGRSGTFLRTVMQDRKNYSERGGMRPLQTGALQVVIHPYQKDFEAII